MAETHDITALLARLKAGELDAGSELIQKIYPDLHNLAIRCLRGERQGHSLQPTLLVNEVYLRLMGQHEVDWRSRSHFFAVAARAMRNILVDYARARNAEKRGGGIPRADLDGVALMTAEQSGLVLAVHECLERLAELDPRQSQVVEMRFFGGLTEQEIAAVLGVSERTIKRDWTMARAWLRAELKS